MRWNWNQGSHFLVEAWSGLASTTKSNSRGRGSIAGSQSQILGLEQWAANYYLLLFGLTSHRSNLSSESIFHSVPPRPLSSSSSIVSLLSTSSWRISRRNTTLLLWAPVRQSHYPATTSSSLTTTPGLTECVLSGYVAKHSVSREFVLSISQAS